MPQQSHPNAAPTLVLAHYGDVGAAQVVRALGELYGAHSVTFVTDLDLLGGRWEQRLGADGVSTTVELRDGRVLEPGKIGIVYNRLRYAIPHSFDGAFEADRLYAQAETNALWLSWLASFECPVVPAPTPPSLACSLPPLPTVLASACSAGLRARRFVFASDARFAPVGTKGLEFWAAGWNAPVAGHESSGEVARHHLGRGPCIVVEPVAEPTLRLLVVGSQVVGPAPSDIVQGCRRLSALLQCEVLGVTMGKPTGDGSTIPSATEYEASGWRLCAVEASPEPVTWEEVIAVAQYIDKRRSQHVLRA